MYVQGKLGILELSLCYQPASETITIVIIKARDLKAKDINGLSGNISINTNIDAVKRRSQEAECWIQVSYLSLTIISRHIGLRNRPILLNIA